MVSGLKEASILPTLAIVPSIREGEIRYLTVPLAHSFVFFQLLVHWGMQHGPTHSQWGLTPTFQEIIIFSKAPKTNLA